MTVSGGGGGGNCPCSIWAASATPQSGPSADSSSVELGTRFRSTTAGNVTAIRFYKSAADGGAHTGSLWSSSGQLLGQVTFSGESTSGWQQANLPAPVAIDANTWYVVSYHASGGSYYGDNGYFATQGQTNGPLYAARDGESGSNGLYAYSSSVAFPTQTYNSSSYWADIVFDTGTAPPGDTTAPVVTIGTPTGSDIFSTTASTLALGGTASDAVGVAQVTWSNAAGGSGTATGTTAWSVASVALVVGTNVITVTARDAAGNASTDTLTVTRTAVDATPPVVTITAPTSATTLSTALASVALSGTSSDAVGVTQVTWSNSAGGSGTATGTTSWSAGSVALTMGSNVFTVTARDAAGNTSSDVLTITRTADTTAPVVTITAPTSATTLSTVLASVTLGGTSSDAVGVTQVTWTNSAGGSGTATGTTSWNAGSVALVIGVNVITVTAGDAAGNTSTDVLTITRAPDTTVPTVAITTPDDCGHLHHYAATLTVRGTASDNAGVTQVTWSNSAGGGGTATGTTSWSVTGTALVIGTNVFTVTARDAAGNTSMATLTVTRTDATRPTVTITSPTSSANLSTTLPAVTLGGTASDNVGVTQVTWTNSAGGGGTATGTTSWSAGSVALVMGVNVLTVTASDAAGNVRTDTLTVTRNPDITAPLVTITTPTSATTFTTTAASLTVGGTASDTVGVTQVTWVSLPGGPQRHGNRYDFLAGISCTEHRRQPHHGHCS